MPELRATPRIAVALEVSLDRKVGSAVHARTCDLSRTGACITCARPLRVDEEIHFDLALPRGDRLDGTARVLRQQRHDMYALRFEQMSPACRGALDAFVDGTAPSAPL